MMGQLMSVWRESEWVERLIKNSSRSGAPHAATGMLRDDSGNGDGRPNMPRNVLGDRPEICSAAAWLLVHYPYGLALVVIGAGLNWTANVGGLAPSVQRSVGHR